MSKEIQCSVFILILGVLSIIALVVFFSNSYTTIHFSESDAVIENPSRGFYIQFDSARLDKISEVRNSGVTLILLGFDIKDYTDRDIAQEKLDELTDAFNKIRVHNLKVIFRAAYGFSDPLEFSDPTSIEIIKSHLKQISPILKENSDLLLTVQAGFLGQWGEWHHSNLGDSRGSPTPLLVNEFLVALSEAVPSPISIAVRRPSFIRMIDSDLIDMRRIALHNDALLSSDSDMGTYDQPDFNREEELEFIEDSLFSVPNGGEMTNLSEYTEPLIVLKEFSQLKLTYLNRNYNKAVLTQWASIPYDNMSFFDVIEQKLGYRWYMESVKIPTHFKSKQKVNIKLTLMNSGFSSITLPYRAELIISSEESKKYIIPFENVNLQDLRPSQTLTMSISLELEETIKKFSLGLRLIEDISEAEIDSQLMIRLANDDLSFDDGINNFATYALDENLTYFLVLSD